MFSPLNSKPIVKPNQTPETNGTNNKPEPTTLNLTTPEESRDINQKIISDRTIPECDNVGKKPAPERVTRKPPKLKTKAITSSELKLFLAQKKKERELKQENLRGKVINIPTKPPSINSEIATNHPIPPNPLQYSAQGTRRDTTALSTAESMGYQNQSANLRGIHDMSGTVLLADKQENLGA